MFRRSLMAASFALATIASAAGPSQAASTDTRQRVIVHHLYTYAAPSPAYYGPSYPPAYSPAAAVASLPGAAVCLAFSLIGAC